MAEPEKDGGVDFEGSFAGQKLKGHGLRLIDLVIAVALLYSVIWPQYSTDEKIKEIGKKAAFEHQQIVTVAREIEMALQEQTYLSTLSEAERRRLNLGMPPSLKVKLRAGMYPDARNEDSRTDSQPSDTGRPEGRRRGEPR